MHRMSRILFRITTHGTLCTVNIQTKSQLKSNVVKIQTKINYFHKQIEISPENGKSSYVHIRHSTGKVPQSNSNNFDNVKNLKWKSKVME